VVVILAATALKKPEDYHGPLLGIFLQRRMGKTKSKYIGKQLPVETS